jgi:hypothetical protein
MKDLLGVLHGMTWIIFQGLPLFRQPHLKEKGLAQNQETTTLPNLTTLNLLELFVPL